MTMLTRLKTERPETPEIPTEETPAEPAAGEPIDERHGEQPADRPAGDKADQKAGDGVDNKANNEADRKCVFVIFNPVSGKSDPDERKAAISGALAAQGYTCQFLATTEQWGAKALAREALEDGVDLVAVSGGDGTVREVLSALVGTDVPVAVLPAGTGNLLSRNLGIPATVPEAVEVALSGTPHRLDLVRSMEDSVNDAVKDAGGEEEDQDVRYFAIMAGMGLDGKVIEEADRAAKDKLGVLAYFLAAARNLGRRRTPFLIRLDDRPPISRRAKSVLIANMGKMTGGLEAIPTASPADGLLDVGIVKARTPGQWLRLLGYGLLGRAQEAPELEVHQARRVRIEARQPQPVQFDGEEGGRRRELSAEVVPGAVVVLIPEGALSSRDSRDSRDCEQPLSLVARQLANQRLLVSAGVLLVAALGVGAWLLRRSRERKQE